MTNWAYSTPLESPPEGVTLNERVIEINGMPFQKRSDTNYKHDYYRLMELVEETRKYTKEQRQKNPEMNELNLYRQTIQQDLWFFVYFVMKNPLANHPFIVEACKEIENEQGDSLEVWARDHLKTTIISIARSCQKILNDPERRIGIFCAVRPLAVKIQNVIKALFESPFLVKCFPDILYEDPSREAEKWSEEGGLIVKRQGFFREPTVSSWGLVEGLPAGPHMTDLVYDDIVTQEYQSPEIMQKICDNFDMSENLGTRDVVRTVVGTFYRHDDPLTYIRDKKDLETGEPMFKTRKKPATENGEYNGKAVFLPERTMRRKRSGNQYFFHCQQLLDPTPRGMQKLDKDKLISVARYDLPKNLYKFMLIDGSGDKGRRVDRAADAWAFGVIGVEPYRNDKGASKIYILDLIIEEMDLVKAQQTAVDMYCRNGRILKLGIEKVAMSTTEVHIAAALRAKGKYLSIEAGNLEILKPAGRKKSERIEANLSGPLLNSNVHILESIPAAYQNRLKMEMDRFPAWHDDGLDMLSYIYDVIKDYRFGARPESEKEESKWDIAFRKANQMRGSGNGWQVV
jgi:hypothetical protein